MNFLFWYHYYLKKKIKSTAEVIQLHNIRVIIVGCFRELPMLRRLHRHHISNSSSSKTLRHLRISVDVHRCVKQEVHISIAIDVHRKHPALPRRHHHQHRTVGISAIAAAMVVVVHRLQNHYHYHQNLNKSYHLTRCTQRLWNVTLLLDVIVKRGKEINSSNSMLSLTLTLDVVIRLPTDKRLILYTLTSVNYNRMPETTSSTVNYCQVKNYLF